MRLSAGTEETAKEKERICNTLPANPIMESYTYELQLQ
ncbi:phosphoribosylformylglycinamidine synthase subunit PurS [Botryobacter ruber]|nr:phosphoribosylformylglycinamidine synthase subunit PurS [Botryobacter ruber]